MAIGTTSFLQELISSEDITMVNARNVLGFSIAICVLFRMILINKMAANKYFI